jgi:hypothetical protein
VITCIAHVPARATMCHVNGLELRLKSFEEVLPRSSCTIEIDASVSIRSAYRNQDARNGFARINPLSFEVFSQWLLWVQSAYQTWISEKYTAFTSDWKRGVCMTRHASTSRVLPIAILVDTDRMAQVPATRPKSLTYIKADKAIHFPPLSNSSTPPTGLAFLWYLSR